jgi:prepilin-type N-terminal cleavage/methylation domain-containing protein
MTHRDHRRVRRGFTLIELLVGLVLFGIIGALCTNLLTTQGRFFDRQAMGNAARNVSRASLNRVVSDFRMIEATGGVVAASPTSLTLRIPFAIGVMCGTAAGAAVTQLTLLPVDSTTYANATDITKGGVYGYAWRNFQTGAYSYVENPATEAPGVPAVCTAKNVTTVTNGKVVQVSPVLPGGAGLGTPVFLYQLIRYEFKASTAVPGKLGLYRTVIAPNGGESTEELVAPFANTAGWKFFTITSGSVAQVAPPATLSDIRGLELHLDGTSESIAVTKPAAESAPFTTAVFFKNRTN